MGKWFCAVTYLLGSTKSLGTLKVESPFRIVIMFWFTPLWQVWEEPSCLESILTEGMGHCLPLSHKASVEPSLGRRQSSQLFSDSIHSWNQLNSMNGFLRNPELRNWSMELLNDGSVGLRLKHHPSEGPWWPPRSASFCLRMVAFRLWILVTKDYVHEKGANQQSVWQVRQVRCANRHQRVVSEQGKDHEHVAPLYIHSRENPFKVSRCATELGVSIFGQSRW